MVEIFRRNFLASMVPVIVNAILNEHQLVIDIVAFVIKGDFHRSRLAEKQRGKILAGWVTRKMRTIAQYSIRDPNGQDVQMMISEEPAGRTSTSTSAIMRAGGPPSIKGSLRAGSTLGMTAQMNNLNFHMAPQELPGPPQQQHNPMSNFTPPPGPAELPAPDQRSSYYPSNIPELSDTMRENDRTPTDSRPNFLPHLDHGGPMDYSPIDRTGVFDDNEPGNYQNAFHPQQHQYGAPVPDILRPGPAEEHIGQQGQTFYSDSTPYGAYNEHQDQQLNQQDQQHAWTMDSQHSNGAYDRHSYTAGADESYSTGGYNGGGGLRVANRDSSESESADEGWRRDALAQINFAGGGGGGGGQGAQGGHAS